MIQGFLIAWKGERDAFIDVFVGLSVIFTWQGKKESLSFKPGTTAVRLDINRRVAWRRKGQDDQPMAHLRLGNMWH